MAGRKVVRKGDGSKTVISGGKIVGNLPSGNSVNPTSGPVDQPSGLFHKVVRFFKGTSGQPSNAGYSSPFPPPPSLKGSDYASAYGDWSLSKAPANSGGASSAPSWPDATTLSREDAQEIFSESFYRSKEYGPHRRFDVHDSKHDRIADMAELIRSEADTPRRVGRPGVDDFAYVRQGDLGLQVRATRQLASDVLDMDSPSHSRVEGLSVYGRDTIALAREINDSEHNESSLATWGQYPQPDGSEKRVDVLHPKAWKLIELVERDQKNSERLEKSRGNRPAEWKSPTRQYPSRFSL